MLRQICRHGRLSGFIQQYMNTDSIFSIVLKTLSLDSVLASTESQDFTSNEESPHNSKGEKISPELYNSILAHINVLWPNTSFQHHNDLHHPLDAQVLPPVAVPIQHITHKGHKYSTFSTHSGGSSISFHCKNGEVDVGFIISMWTQVLLGVSYLYIIVAPHTALTPSDKLCSPYTSQPGFMGTLVYSHPNPTQKQQQVLIEQRQYEVMLHTMTIHLVHLVLNQE